MNKVLSMIGLATKAGKVASGEFSVSNAVKKRQALLVIIAEDASDNTRKEFTDMCSYRHVPMIIYGTRETLGMCTGHDYRASLAITDAGFKDTILRLVDQENKQ